MERKKSLEGTWLFHRVQFGKLLLIVVVHAALVGLLLGARPELKRGSYMAARLSETTIWLVPHKERAVSKPLEILPRQPDIHEKSAKSHPVKLPSRSVSNSNNIAITSVTRADLSLRNNDDVSEPGDKKPMPVFDMDKARKAIADMVAEEKSTRRDSNSGLKQETAAEAAIARAFRRKCDDSYFAKGNVKLQGLARLPSLLHGALTDEGCKW
jgi:hypothetical protein